MSTQRQSVVGAYAQAKLNAGIGPTDLTFTVQASQGAGAPAGPTYFVMSLERTTGGNEEKVLCSSRSGDTFTVAAGGRGYDGTAAIAHSSGATVDHIVSASALDTHDDHVWTTTNDQHPQYLRTDSSRAGTGVQAFQAVSLTGLTGAVAGARIVGGTTSGSPGAGTWLKGDTVVAQDGKAWICTVAGTPGTWVQVGAVYTPPVTTKGDLFGFDTAGNRIPVGANGLVLTPDSTQTLGVKWGYANYVGCSVYANTTQAIANGTETVIGFDSSDVDTNAFHSNVTNNSRITIPAGLAGKYALHAAGSIAGSAASDRVVCYLKKNGATYLRSVATTVQGANDWSVELARTVALVATDYVEFVIRDFTAARTLQGDTQSARSTVLEATYLGA